MHNGKSDGASQACSVRQLLSGRSIVLIGLMGAGKTSIGKRLAASLDMPFSDADQEIEQAAGKTINEIFADNGEAYFRDGERRVIARLLRGGPIVLATGGGAFMNSDTRARIAASGLSIWLRADLDTLMSRVLRRDTRPLLKSGNPRAVMEKLITERYPVYAQADLTIESRDTAHEVIIDEIVQALLSSDKLLRRSCGESS